VLSSYQIREQRTRTSLQSAARFGCSRRARELSLLTGRARRFGVPHRRAIWVADAHRGNGKPL